MKRNRGFTLIEAFAAMAMMTVLGGAFFTVVVMTIREEAQERVKSALRQDGQAVVRSMLHDARVATKVELAGEQAATTAAQSLVMIGTFKGKDSKTVYRREGASIVRETWRDGASSPIMQTLAVNARDWRIERAADRLFRVHLELALDRYMQLFSRKYDFAIGNGTGL